MATTDPTVTAHLVEEHNELHYACGGMWDVNSIEELFQTLNETCLPLVKARKPIYSLADFTETLTQDQATAEKIGAYMKEVRNFGLKRTAVFGAPPLMKLQYKRISPDLELEFFETKAEALEWLRSNR